MEQTAEVVFAQRLASNEKTIRDRALKKLRKYLSVRDSESAFSRDDLRKLWKGLHYSMWMQDKPLLQEELSERICGLLKVFSDGQAALNFAAAFFATQASEWNRLDQWRMDKYMMLTRDFLRATFQVLKSRKWEGSLVSSLAQLVEEEVMDANKEENPDGLRLHLADMWLEELTKAGANELKENQIVTLLKPYINYITMSNRDVITDRIIKSVFNTILEDSSPLDSQTENEETTEESEQQPKLQYDLRAIAQALFEQGKQKKVKPRVRRKLYTLVQRLKDAAPKEGPQKAEKRKLSEEEEESQPAKKQKKMKVTAGATPAKKSHAIKETPQSAEKHVVFDLERNSSRGLQEFVMSAADSPSPYLPSRSPKQGILKDSPGVSPSPSSKPAKKGAGLKTMAKGSGRDTPKGKKLLGKGKNSATKRGNVEERSSGAVKGKKKNAKLLARKKARMMKKSKHR